MDEADNVPDPDAPLVDCPWIASEAKYSLDGSGRFGRAPLGKRLGAITAVQAYAGRGLNVLWSIALPKATVE